MVENWSEVKSGDINAWDDLVVPARNLKTIDELAQWTDMESFLNMYALHTFAGNTDFVNNNIVCWRPWDGDGRWRWLLKDLDRLALEWQDVRHDYFSYIKGFHWGGENNWDYCTSHIFNLILSTTEGKRLLADRLAVAMGDYLQKDYMDEVRKEMYDEIHPEYRRHMYVYFTDTDAWRYIHWKSSVEYISQWWPTRTDYIYNTLLPKYCDMTTSPYQLQVDRKGKRVSLNGIEIYRPVFNGRYYRGRNLELRCEDPECGWRIVITYNNNAKEEIITQESSYVLSITSSQKKVYAEVLEPTGISTVKADEDNGSFTALGPADVYNLQGIRVKTIEHDDQIDELPAGFYIISGKKVFVR